MSFYILRDENKYFLPGSCDKFFFAERIFQLNVMHNISREGVKMDFLLLFLKINRKSIENCYS